MTAATRERARRGKWGRWLIALLLVAVAIRLGGIAGLVRPIRVTSESMAPHLIGPHYALRCDDCFAQLQVDALRFRPGDRLACWNCGYAANRGFFPTMRDGERVLVDRFAYQWRRPRRWETVAMRTEDGRVLGKRVLGFPGEILGFEDGDLIVNGKRICKSVADMQSTRILVHDSNYEASLRGSPRAWQAADRSTWKESGRAWYAAVTGPLRVSPVWLEFTHLDTDMAVTDESSRRKPVPVRDDLNYNGNRPRGTVHAVPDVWLEADVKCSGDAVFVLRFRTANREWRAEVDVRRQECTLWEGGRFLERRSATLPRDSRRAWTCEWGLCDRRIRLRVDGRSVFARDVALPIPAGSSAHPIAVGIQHGKIDVGARRVWRDIYYFGPDPTAIRWQAPRRLAGLFIAGDNQQTSIDSRLQGTYLAGDARLWGRVIRVGSR